MSKNDLNEVLANAKKIPTAEDLLPKSKKRKRHTLISMATRKKPKKKKKVEESTLQENFLKQVENYNDFIIQNDLNVDLINPDHDYDFSAFGSNEDWATESERLADRLSDRKIEIKQNEDAGEFAGLELENGVPSYESVKNMTKEQFKAYEDKYLSDTFKKIDEQIKIDEDRPEFEEELKEEIIRQDHQRNGEPYVAKEMVAEPLVEEKVVAEEPNKEVIVKPVASEPLSKSAIAWELVKGTHPGVENVNKAVKSAGKVIDQGEPINALQDAGRGVMSGLADTAGSIADVGGLLPNRVADVAHDSADWWRNEYEIPDSEAGRLGSELGNSAVMGLGGGVAGKAVGNAYKGLKLSGEALRNRAAVAAKNAEKIVMSNPSLKNKLRHQTQLVRQNAYENLTNRSPYKSLNSNESLGSVLTNNVKRNFDDRAMLKRNDAELEHLYSQGIPLDDALRIQQGRWDRLPDTVRDAGLLMGLEVAQ